MMRLRFLSGLITLATVFITSNAVATNGHILHGVGSTNQAMGGAGIATALDATGSLHNNTSSASFIEGNALEFGFELFMPDRSMASNNGMISGKVDSETREAAIPSMALLYKLDGPWTFGFSALGIAGFGVDYPADSTNPLSAPLGPPPAGGFGSIYSNYQFMQLTAGWAYKASPDLSYGFGLNLDWSSLAVDPWPATNPNATGYYPTGTHAATAWGKGFTLSTTYKPKDNLTLGAVIKSPQTFDDFEWNSQYPDTGAAKNFKFQLDYPMIVGGGLSYQKNDKLLLAADVKWINYSETEGFEKKNFDATGAVQGFGWEDIWTVSLGAQYRVSPRMVVRGGYNYGENPIPENQQFFNVFAPAIVEHHINIGLGYEFTSMLEMNLAYYHALENDVAGPMINSSNAPVDGTSVTNTLSEDSISMQMALKF